MVAASSSLGHGRPANPSHFTTVCSSLWGTDAWVDVWSGFRYPLFEAGTLGRKIQDMFCSGISLNFPMITEVCELAEKRPYEIADTVKLLGQTLREDQTSKLKALTLLNEMVYNLYVVWCVAEDR